jgi:hypothetical protein
MSKQIPCHPEAEVLGTQGHSVLKLKKVVNGEVV